MSVLALLCAMLPVLRAQYTDTAKNPLLSPLQSGTLTVWIVTHNTGARSRPRATQVATAAPQYQEKTMAEFGQTAGSVGQTAGSTGQTAGSFGQTAGSTGQTAGSTGQTAGSFGNTASTVGKNAGDAGQTVGSFGVSSTDLAAAAAAANRINTQGPAPQRDRRWEHFFDDFQHDFPRLQLRIVDVFDDELESQVEAAAGTADAPDLLLGNPLPVGWSRWNSAMLEKYGLVPLGRVVRVSQTENDISVRSPIFDPEAAILKVRGRAPDAARAFYVWLADEGDHATGRPPDPGDQSTVASIAISALRGVLQGEPVTQGKYLIDIPAERVVNGFGVVALRAVESLPQAFGVVHALAVLRKDDSGHWKLLQLSPYLTRPMQGNAYNLLLEATQGREKSNPLGNEGPKPLGISQAAPQDGDTRSPQPELWWDNLGGASIQVVEWGMTTGPTNLFFVKDDNPKLRTRVIARFATGGRYRWRVWSIGVDGALVLSPWRTLNILGR